MRVAAIRYINALPLIYGLRSDPSVQLLLDAPSACYRRLVAGEVDVALIPVFGTQTDPGIRALKGLGIAALNRTESVYLFSTKPLDRVASVVTDPGSISSATLVKIILRGKYNNIPRFETGTVSNVHEALRRHDAALIIGDDAIMTEKTDYDHYDLATEWYSMTQLPFVFAVWAANRMLTDAEQESLRNSYVSGSENMENVIAEAGRQVTVRGDFLKKYYNDHLHYVLSRADYEGLLKFLSLASEYQLVERVRKDLWM